MEINQGNFLYALSKIRQNLFSFLEREMAAVNIRGISPSDGDILFLLDRRGELTIQEIAAFTVKDKSTVSSVIKRLEGRGYVTKKRGDGDGRTVRIALTQKAKKTGPLLWKISASMNEKMFSRLSEDEKNKLFELMGKIYRNIPECKI